MRRYCSQATDSVTRKFRGFPLCAVLAFATCVLVLATVRPSHATEDDGPPIIDQPMSEHVYIEKKVKEFAEEHPKRFAVAGEDNVRAFIRLSLDKGRKHGMDADREINGLRIMMYFLGRDFDTDPQYPWASLITFPPKDYYAEETPPSFVYLKAIYARFYTFYMQAIGEDGQHLRAANKRFAALTFEDILALRTDDDILAAIARVFPERYTQIPEETLRGPVLQAAAAKARARELDPVAGKALFAALIFSLGISVDTDPLHAYLFEELNQSPQPDLARERACFDRIRKLASRM